MVIVKIKLVGYGPNFINFTRFGTVGREHDTLYGTCNQGDYLLLVMLLLIMVINVILFTPP